MQIICAGRPVDFKLFQELFPLEAGWIEPNLELYQDVILHIDETWKVGLVGVDFSAFGLDLAKELSYHKRYFQKSSIYKENLARALGLKRGAKLKVCDLTAGMLSDTALMLAMGIEVVAYERNALMAALIHQEVKKVAPVGLSFHYGECIKVDVDVYYFDPMYEQKNEKSAPKKQMMFLRQTVGVDQDAKDFALNISQRGKRLVIKRSKKADPLLKRPIHQVIGKSTCYDVY